MVSLNISIPKGFLDEEVRCGYTVTNQMKEVWAIELDLLEEFRRVCNKHKLKFSANSGTLLGAIRHKGFIPWDDDIDLMMPRDDYEKLCQIASAEFTPPYYWEDFHSEPKFAYGKAKLLNLNTTGYENKYLNRHGIFIDIFPFDSIVDDPVLLNKQGKELISLFKKLQRIAFCDLSYCREPGISLARRLARLFVFCKNRLLGRLPGGTYHQSIFKKFELVCTRYNNNECKDLGGLSYMLTNILDVVPKNDFEHLLEVDFEFTTIPIVVNYDYNLRKMYGEYQQFINGGALHTFKIIDTERPYTQVLPEYGIEL